MTGLVSGVRNKLDPKCVWKNPLKKNGCKVLLTGAPHPRLVVDFDKPGSPLRGTDTRCDYLFIAEKNQSQGWIAPLELQKGKLHASKVANQLKAGAKVAQRLISPKNPIKFRPTAVYSGSIHKRERRLLREKRNRIRFHKQIEGVRLISCGEMLTNAF